MTERCVPKAASGNPPPINFAKLWSMWLHADQRGVMQAVIRPFELDDFVTSSGRAREAYGVHCRFGAAVAEADHLDGKAIANLFRQFPLHVVRHSEHRPSAEPFFDRLHYRGMAMARHQRAKT